ncbi:MAG: thymidylate synthase [Ghiorsea sp.]
MRAALYILALLLCLPSQQVSAEVLTATDKVVEKFMQLDTDESESVSYREYKSMVLERLEQRFEQMDTNKDSSISEDEYRNFWTKQKSQYYRPKR